MKFKAVGIRTVVIGIALSAGLMVGGYGVALAAGQLNRSNDRGPNYPTNANGQTYGSDLQATTIENQPDLILAHGVDGTVGYVKAADLIGEAPETPEEAVALQKKQAKSSREIPLYDADGKTVIGVFKITAGDAKTIAG